MKEKVFTYRFAGEDWRARLDLLAVEFEGIDGPQLPALHERLRWNARAWLIARRLFGFRPVLPSNDEDTDNLELWSRERLQAVMGLSREQLRQEVEAMRGVWLGLRAGERQLALEVEPPRAAVKADAQGQVEMELSPDKILEEHGFTDGMLTWEGRASEEIHLERGWLAEKLREWESLFRNPIVKSLARQTVLTELQMRRLEMRVLAVSPDTERYQKADKQIRQLRADYQEQLAQLDKLAPYAGLAAGKVKFQGTLSEVIAGIQQYQGDPDNELVDGVFSAMEIQVLLRRSAQSPETKYRAGLVVYLAAAREGLMDSRWKNRFTNAQLRALDAAWNAGAKAALDAEGQHVPDLLQDGPAGEYEELVSASAPAVEV